MGRKWNGGSSARQEIPDGEYQIAPRLDNNKVISAAGNGTTDGTNVVLDSCVDDPRYTFNVEWLGNGYYKIVNKNSNLALDLARGLCKGNVELCRWLDQNNQKWIIRSCGNGYFNIISKCNGAYLDLSNCNTDNGTNIAICVGWGRSGGDAQQWRFIPWDSTPQVTVLPSASGITYGQTLGDSVLRGGTASTAGRFVWKDSSIRLTCSAGGTTLCKAVFIPSDTDHWTTTEVDVPVRVNPAQNAPDMPETTMTIPYTQKTVGDAALPYGWVWQEADRGKALAVKKAVTATAIYTGVDRGNYVNEKVTISMTRSACSHPENRQELRKAVAAAVGKAGYTGDVYCTDCQTVIKTGTVIAALSQEQGSSGDSENTGANTETPDSSENQGFSGDTENAGSNTENTGTAPGFTDGSGINKGDKYTYNNILYKVLTYTSTEGTAEAVSAANKSITNVNIPNTIKIKGCSFKVVSVKSSAFAGCTKMKTAKLGKNVSSIGKKAFYGCKALTSVNIPAGVMKLEDSTFIGCKKLKTVSGCAGITTVGSKAFYKCEKLVTVGSKSGVITLSKVKTIGNSAFYGCKAVRKVNLASKALTKIGDFAFQGCSSMKSFVSKAGRYI